METTESVQDYLKAIYFLAETGGEVTTTALAQRLSISPASVTAMLKRLAVAGKVRYHRYQGVELTEGGRKLALEVIRHHRLLEAYLHDSLGISWDRVHAEAEVLEHVLSEDLEEAIAKSLGYPTHDPHGDPIPPKKGRHNEISHPSLESFGAGKALVERVSDQDPKALRYLASKGILPGTVLEVESPDELDETIWVKVGRKRHPIGHRVASYIFVSRH
ncbi:MAG: metal-dependent transcriptional regulator [Actinomycetota bacterium]|nr:metal-dependent transcriptional regulator [Actinomycetota bacterium]